MSKLSQPSLIAIQLLTVKNEQDKKGEALKIIMDASVARLLIAGQWGACTGSGDYSNGDLAHWLATSLSTWFKGVDKDLKWADVYKQMDEERLGTATAVRQALKNEQDNVNALKQVEKEIKSKIGSQAWVEYDQGSLEELELKEWAETYVKTIQDQMKQNTSMTSTFLIFSDQKSALKALKSDVFNVHDSLSVEEDEGEQDFDDLNPVFQ